MALRLITPVILSGGSGTRLWPASRDLSPKQFVSLFPGGSLFQATLRRCQALGLGKPIIVSSIHHANYVSAQIETGSAAAILYEPVARNTAPAIVAAALSARAQDPDALLLVLPSDHLINDEAAFKSCVVRASAAAASGWLLTFGIVPSHPHTGYGYIEAGGALPINNGALEVKRFAEKPSLEAAREFLAKGNWFWNSGMFLFPAKLLLEEIARIEPGLIETVDAALSGAKQEAGGLALGSESFARARSISIDYALMERTRRAAVTPAEIGWSDIGAWDAVWSISDKDDQGVSRRGNIVALETERSIFWSDGPAIAALGVSDIAVIATDDAVMVLPLARAQDVRAITAELAKSGSKVSSARSRVDEVWGWRERVSAGGRRIGDLLIIKPHAAVDIGRLGFGAAMVLKGEVNAQGSSIGVNGVIAPGVKSIAAGKNGAEVLVLTCAEKSS